LLGGTAPTDAAPTADRSTASTFDLVYHASLADDPDAIEVRVVLHDVSGLRSFTLPLPDGARSTRCCSGASADW
jgi:hypothetical protein